jgi:putative membrane-bound dehydrogenase-like protein
MRRLLPMFCALIAGISTGIAADKPVPLAEAAGKFTVPKGFNVTLFAGEPAVVQPIAFTFDDRGRMWVVECLSYPQWRADGKGSDRVVVLEDTDGDGVHDKRTVVLDNGSNLSGIEVGFGGVWLCSTPNLVFIPIENDKPSGPPQILLDGWNLKDAKHNVFNGLAWGPDGWLYGCNGIQTRSNVGAPGTPAGQRTFLDAGVWRFHPTRKVFDVVAVGMTNPWGLDWDDRGEMFATNCVIDHLWHLVPGGRYQRMYGQDQNPYSYGHMGSAVDYKHWGSGSWTESRADKATGAVKKEHDTAGGGHAHSGAAIYLGEQFPAEYRDTLFTCNIHGSRLNNDGLVRTPGGMKGVRRPDFAFANDPWFRGIATKQGPEGSLYVCDWSDTGECHNYEVADKTNGRVYRISYGTAKSFKGDVSTMTDAELMDAQSSKNEWLVRRARRVLQERVAAGKKLDAAKLVAQLNTKEETAKLRAYWALAATGQMTTELRTRMAGDKGEAVRVWSARIGNDVARGEESPFVRAALATAAAAKPRTWSSLAATLSHPEDNADANLTLMYWLAVQPLVAGDPAGALAFAQETPIERVRVNIARHILTLPKTDATTQLALVMPTLLAAKSPAVQRDLLTGIQQAFEGRVNLVAPAGWATVTDALSKSADPRARRQAEAVAVLVGDPTAIAAMRTRFADAKEPTEIRQFALQQLLARRVPGMADALRGLLNDTPMRSAALRGLAAYSNPASATAILDAYASFTAAEKADAVQTLASRTAFALALLDAVERGAVPKLDINTYTARQLLALNDKTVSARLGTVWGTVRPASATRVEQTVKLKALLTTETLAKADLGNGRRLFAVNCAACHKLFDDGGNVGPELTGAQRTSLDYVLENVLDPSAVVANDYRLTTFSLVDGRTVAGVVRKETPQTLTVRTLNEEVLIPVADVEARKTTQLSIMPDGLFDKLTDAELRDLVAYLASPRQVPLAALPAK